MLPIITMACGIVAIFQLTKSGIQKFKMRLLESRLKNVQKVIDQLYADDINPYFVSLQYREQNKIDGEEFTYGEVVVPSFAKLLSLTSPKSGEIFYDLGCGVGKAVFTAALCFPFLEARGIELLPPLFEICSSMKNKFYQLVSQTSYFKKDAFNVGFLKGDLIKERFSDGKIFFLNATCFRDRDWLALQKKINDLSVGSRLIVVTRQITLAHFELIEAGTYQMSWGPSSVYIYEKVS